MQLCEWRNHMAVIEAHKWKLKLIYTSSFRLFKKKLTQWILPGELKIDHYGILWCAEFYAGIPEEILKCFTYKTVNLELIWQYPPSELCTKQTKSVCANQFNISLWASMAAMDTVMLCTLPYIEIKVLKFKQRNQLLHASNHGCSKILYIAIYSKIKIKILKCKQV